VRYHHPPGVPQRGSWGRRASRPAECAPAAMSGWVCAREQTNRTARQVEAAASRTRGDIESLAPGLANAGEIERPARARRSSPTARAEFHGRLPPPRAPALLAASIELHGLSGKAAPRRACFRRQAQERPGLTVNVWVPATGVTPAGMPEMLPEGRPRDRARRALR